MSQQVPLNKKLWDMIIVQARARYATYPSPGASHWVHTQYEKYGGKFGDAGQMRRHIELSKKFQEKRREAMKNHKGSDDKEKGGKKHEDK